MLEAAHTGQVGGTIGAPVTEKTYDFGFPITHIVPPLNSNTADNGWQLPPTCALVNGSNIWAKIWSLSKPFK
jgi:hypothetical protein